MNASQKIGLNRLRKLANHLMRRKRGHKKFYFGAWNNSYGLKCPLTGRFGEKELDGRATRCEVAANIDEFIKTKNNT